MTFPNKVLPFFINLNIMTTENLTIQPVFDQERAPANVRLAYDNLEGDCSPAHRNYQSHKLGFQLDVLEGIKRQFDGYGAGGGYAPDDFIRTVEAVLYHPERLGYEINRVTEDIERLNARLIDDRPSPLGKNACLRLSMLAVADVIYDSETDVDYPAPTLSQASREEIYDQDAPEQVSNEHPPVVAGITYLPEVPTASKPQAGETSRTNQQLVEDSSMEGNSVIQEPELAPDSPEKISLPDMSPEKMEDLKWALLQRVKDTRQNWIWTKDGLAERDPVQRFLEIIGIEDPTSDENISAALDSLMKAMETIRDAAYNYVAHGIPINSSGPILQQLKGQSLDNLWEIARFDYLQDLRDRLKNPEPMVGAANSSPDHTTVKDLLPDATDNDNSDNVINLKDRREVT